jgi:hypothetical protein
MTIFSKKIINILENAESGEGIKLVPVPKSGSVIKKGDILLFKYRIKQFKNNAVRQRTVMAVRPVEKDAKTGNTLLTCVRVVLPNDLSIKYLKSLYKNRSLIKENEYRTYIMSKIIGNIFLLSTYNPEDKKNK